LIPTQEKHAPCLGEFSRALNIAGMKRTDSTNERCSCNLASRLLTCFAPYRRCAEGRFWRRNQWFRRAAELDPISASGYARIAYLHYVKGYYRSAAEHLRKSFHLDRDCPEARLYDGLLHFQQKDYDGVIQCLSSSSVPLDIGLLAAAHGRKGSESRVRKCIQELAGWQRGQYAHRWRKLLRRSA